MPRFDREAVARAVKASESASARASAPPAQKGTERRGLGPAWLWAIAGANGADLASTEYALSKNPNAYESNPLLKGSAGKRAAIKGALTVGEILATRLVGKEHPKAAKTLAAILSALPAALTVNNLRQAHKK
jgi:hypothetical protein